MRVDFGETVKRVRFETAFCAYLGREFDGIVRFNGFLTDDDTLWVTQRCFPLCFGGKGVTLHTRIEMATELLYGEWK